MSDLSLGAVVLSGLVHSPEFSRITLPNSKPEYFAEPEDQEVFKIISSYYQEYGAPPKKEALIIELENNEYLSEDLYRECNNRIIDLYSNKLEKFIDKTPVEWLVKKTEKLYQDRALYLAIRESVGIIDGDNNKVPKTAIPEILQEALSISFESNIGHDYIENAEERFEEYHKVEERVEFALEWLNKITGGGVPKKSMFVWVAPTGVGKTLLMTWSSSQLLMAGKNILYISCEMSETRISERIDAALMDVSLDDMKAMPKDLFMRKIEKISSSAIGKLIVKEYPPASITCMNIRYLLEELRNKKGFLPDVLVVDYLNLLASFRLKGGSHNSYTIMKAVSEELRAIAVEFNLLIMTATQTNREGQNATDFELNEVSESHGISMTADIMIGAISTKELENAGRLRLKQLKNRFGGLSPHNVETVGCDRPKMRIYEVNSSSVSSSNSSGGGQALPTSKTKESKPKASGFKF